MAYTFKKFVLESRVLSKNFSMVINALDIYGVNHQTIKSIKVQKDPDLFIQKIGTTLAGKARVRLYALKSAMYYSGLTGYFIEGDFKAQKKLDDQPWNTEKIIKKVTGCPC